MALMKLCRCNKKIDYNKKYCSKCEKEVEKEKRDRVRRYDKEVRNNDSNKKYTDFYNSKAWRALSEVIRRKYNGLCVMCLLERDEVVDSDVVHHIEELKKRWDLRLVEDNMIPLCHCCHNSIENINYSKKEKIYLKKLIERYENTYR